MKNSNYLIVFAFVLTSFIARPIMGQIASPPKSLPNFQKVNGNLYRGGQPKAEGWAELKKIGIKTVIDLRDNDENAVKEKNEVEKAGLRFINFPLGNWDRPETADIETILAAINLPDNQPIFVHCRRGSDRTGTVIAVYRMTHDGWTGSQASDEAEQFGIGWWQRGMRNFISAYYRDHVKSKPAD